MTDPIQMHILQHLLTMLNSIPREITNCQSSDRLLRGPGTTTNGVASHVELCQFLVEMALGLTKSTLERIDIQRLHGDNEYGRGAGIGLRDLP